MKNITQNLFFITTFVSCLFANAQITNTTGLPGEDLIFYEDMRYLDASGASGYIITVTSAGVSPSGNSSIPDDGLAAGQLGYTRPSNNYPAGDAVDNRSLKIQANDGSANFDTDVWIVVNPIDLSDYDAGSKFFTFSTRTTYREDGGANLDTDTSVLYATDFVKGTDPTTVTWTPISTTPVGDSADMGADGVWTTQMVDLSGVTCGTQFAIAIRRQSSINGPTGGVFDSATNRNGTFNLSDLVFTGSTSPILSLDNENISATEISVYPNPAIKTINISAEVNSIDIKNVSLIDISGKVVLSTDYTEKINVSNLSRGLYLIKFEKQDGGIITKKIVLN